MTKKRKWIMPVCLLLVFLLLLGLYFILKRKNASEEEAESSKIQVLSVESGKVEKFSFQTEDESASFSKKDDEWKNDDDKKFPVDQDALETLLESITSLEAERKLENVDGLSEYGLEDPADTITVQALKMKSWWEIKTRVPVIIIYPCRTSQIPYMWYRRISRPFFRKM